jgi:transposase-like protein
VINKQRGRVGTRRTECAHDLVVRNTSNVIQMKVHTLVLKSVLQSNLLKLMIRNESSVGMALG